MNSERYNIFEKSHKQLHAIIFETGSVLQQTDFSKPEDAQKIFKRINHLVRFFEFHITHENGVIYHAVSLEAPYIIALMEKTNTAILRSSKAVIKKTKEYRSISANRYQVDFENELQAEFFSFTAISLQQLIKEDTVINQLLWNIYTDNQLKNMEAAISENIADSAYWNEVSLNSKKKEEEKNLLSFEMIGYNGYEFEPIGLYNSRPAFYLPETSNLR